MNIQDIKRGFLSIPSMVSTMFRLGPKTIITIFICDIIIAMIPYTNAVILRNLSDNARPGASLSQLLLLAGGMVLLSVIPGIYGSFKSYMTGQYGRSTTLFFRRKLYSKMNRLPVVLFEDKVWHEQMRRIQRLSPTVSEFFSAFMSLSGVIVTSISYFAYLWKITKIAFVIAILSALPVIFLATRLSKSQYSLNRSQFTKQQHVDYLSSVFAAPRAGKEIRVFQSADYLIGLWKKMLRELVKENFLLNIRQSITEFFMFLLCISGYGWLLIHITAKVISGTITPGEVISIIPFTITVVGTLERINSVVKGVNYSLLEWNEINEFYKNNPDTDRAYTCAKTTAISTPLKIELRNVCFQYPNAQSSTLHDISFTIQPGETIALIGKNGSGKSTLMKILTGLYRPDSGELLYSDINAKELPWSEIRKSISFTFQTPIEYPLTVDENISLRKISEDKYKSLLDMVGLQQLDTIRKNKNILSVGFTGGTNLSGGQWQRLAIARSLTRENASLFIFDEPTAALDPEAELEVFRTFKKMTAGSTVIISSHRLGFAREADRIIVIDNGSICEMGKHEELVNSQGLYAQLYETQSKWYRKERQDCVNI